ncbi:M23 family metallopeptidase [Niveibacterium sp. 24ML]|uniref:M23 family metallopeptidase n=1 Tax=Niveibacterium sp. 24ML TaxID=2985512 RepID=UPI0022701ADF|nr:M23 family metallopeptidase [Niveibacterium sp. 24ML]MCX9154795.1 M23 family metallopeptidase [Niveibacterium sp. 24ML]
MLISPPFLPVRNANQTDAQWLETAMSGAAPGYIPRRGDNTIAGSYPISTEMGWHGGMHLVAPNGADGHALAVRAIADGTVVFMRQPTQANDNHDDPLNYGAPEGARCWTSNGVVVIRRDTEIGANAQDQAVAVTFYSVYMHLDSVRATVGIGRAIYRKDEIGEAGYIYGQPHRIHFEIFCDDANLQRLVGRNAGDLPLDRDGRSDVVFGELYFHLPAGTPVYGEKPLRNNPIAHSQPPAPRRGAPLPPIAPLQPTHTTTEAFVIGLRYAHGEGADGHRGDATVNTYRIDGSTEGAALTETDAEYNIYRDATAIANAHPAATRPAPSAVFELLRFGRVINTAHETLDPADVPHWRQIRYPGGTGWVNLNGTNVHKFSDADFPHWKQWRLIDDSTDGDSRCDSATILAWFDGNQNGHVDATEANAGFASVPVQEKLDHAICKFPTEWSAATIDARWGWLKTSTEENPAPLTDEDFAKFMAHANALCFWDGVAGLPAAPWRFHPARFIEAFRRCGWLSRREITQLVPRAGMPNFAGTWAEAERRVLRVNSINLNQVFRKYGFVNVRRQTAFLAQAYIETACLSLLEEVGRAHQQRRRDGTLYWPQPMMQYYAAFFGRGLMQLTWAGTYADYGKYRAFSDHQGNYSDERMTATSEHDWAAPTRDAHDNLVRNQRRWSPRFDPDIVASDGYIACDSGTFFWVQKRFTGTTNIHRLADAGIDTTHIGRMSILVNGGGNGYNERLQYAAFIERFRGDGTETARTGTITATRQGISHGHWTEGAAINLNINYTPQRPN